MNHQPGIGIGMNVSLVSVSVELYVEYVVHLGSPWYYTLEKYGNIPWYILVSLQGMVKYEVSWQVLRALVHQPANIILWCPQH